LTSAHTGEYLAEKTALCLQRYGLENKVSSRIKIQFWSADLVCQILAACLDNASNNLTLVQHLQQRVPHFLGSRSYVRCLAHVINLMAKVGNLHHSKLSY
jgi:hypothetical protein